MPEYCTCYHNSNYKCSLSYIIQNEKYDKDVFNDCVLYYIPTHLINYHSGVKQCHEYRYTIILESLKKGLMGDITKIRQSNLLCLCINYCIDSFTTQEIDYIFNNIDKIDDKISFYKIYDKYKDKFTEVYLLNICKQHQLTAKLIDFLICQKFVFSKKIIKLIFTKKYLTFLAPMNEDILDKIINTWDLTIISDLLEKVTNLGAQNIQKITYLSKIIGMGYKFNNKMIPTLSLSLNIKNFYDFFMDNIDDINYQTLQLFDSHTLKFTADVYHKLNMVIDETFLDINNDIVRHDVMSKIEFVSNHYVENILKNKDNSKLNFLIDAKCKFSQHNLDLLFKSNFLRYSMWSNYDFHFDKFETLYDKDLLYDMCHKYKCFPFKNIQPNEQDQFIMCLATMNTELLIKTVKEKNIDLDINMFEKAVEYDSTTKKRIDLFIDAGLRPNKQIILNLLNKKSTSRFGVQLFNEYY
jgi:hypothetical protein